MYAAFFGLKHEPFSIAPDPRYLFMSERHREALAHLLYGLRGGGGIVLLSGEIGAGKTTVCRCFLEQIPKRCNVAYIFNPKLTVTELLKTVCDEFHIRYEHQGPGLPTVKDYVDALNEFLLRTHAVGQNNVLIIDEAQNLSADVLEQLRLLTNLETHERKLLQIILIGQPELREQLAQPKLEQLAQRVSARFHLQALSEVETAQYVRHRLAVAGMTRSIPFDRDAMQRIHALSRGVPRRINLLCDRALLGAYATGTPRIGRDIVDKAAAEVFDRTPTERRQRHGHPLRERAAVLAAGALAGAALVGGVGWALDGGARWRGGDAELAAARVAPASAPASAASVAAAAPAGSAASASSVATAAPPAAAASSPASAVAASASAPAPLLAGLAPLPRDEAQAWRTLASAWGIELGDGDPCRAAQREQLQCFRSGNGNLALVRTLGRPAILTLHEPGGEPAYALLTGLDGRGATLRANGETQTIPLLTLARLWRGEFATFWRAPPGYASAIAADSTGPAADWLAQRLAALPGSAAQPPGASLQARVQAFQTAHGLKPDGLAGPVTLMQLNRASGIDEPRLQSGPAAAKPAAPATPRQPERQAGR